MRCNHHEDEKTRCTCVETFDAIVAGETIPKLAGYCAIVREAAKHPDRLVSFASDLVTHDRADLTDYSGPFLWILRDSGTVLLKPIARDNFRAYNGRLTVQGILHAFGWKGLDSGLWFWWDGRSLRQVRSPEEAEGLVRDAEHSLEKAA